RVADEQDAFVRGTLAIVDGRVARPWLADRSRVRGLDAPGKERGLLELAVVHRPECDPFSRPAAIDHHGALPARLPQRHRPCPAMRVAFDERARALFDRPRVALPLSRDRNGPVAGVCAAETSCGDDAGAARAVEDLAAVNGDELAGWRGVRRTRRIAGIDAADEAVDDARAGPRCRLAEHAIEVVSADVKACHVAPRGARGIRPACDVADAWMKPRAIDGDEIADQGKELAGASRERFGERRPRRPVMHVQYRPVPRCEKVGCGAACRAATDDDGVERVASSDHA